MSGTSRSVPYDRQTVHHPNPVARFAHVTRLKTSLRLVMRDLGPRGEILDVGAGTGVLLGELGAARPDVGCTAFEPFMALRHPGIRHVTSLDMLPGDRFDVVSAFEVFEHLTPSAMGICVAGIKRVLKSDGRFILSVPIMEGLALPVKEASRALLFRRRSDYRGAELLRGLFGRPVAHAENPLVSHKGFSHRGLATRLAGDFRLIERRFSPFPKLPWWMNSQALLVFGHR